MRKVNDLVSLDELSSLFLFDDVPPDILKWVADTCPIYEIDEGEILIKRGQRNHALYLVLSGRLKIQLDKSDGPAVSYIGQGRCVGEMSVLEEVHTSASVIADCACHVLKIEAQTLWDLIERTSVIAKNLLRLLCTRVRYDNYTITETKKLQQHYEEKSNFDTLTNLRNRRWLDEHFYSYATLNYPLCLLMIDIDYFKDYNDALGHLAGDAAIATVANVITRNINPDDIALRYGGEEFVIILPQAELEHAVDAANNLRERISNQEIVDKDGLKLPSVTVSVGIAQHSSGESREGLLANADNALYEAKRTGRNRVSIAETA